MQIISGGAAIKPKFSGVAFLNGVGELTVSIPAVDLSKAYVIVNNRTYVTTTDTAAFSALHVSAKIATATTIYFARGSSNGQSWCEYQVLEYV